MNIGKETEQIEFKTSLAEERQGLASISAILNKHETGKLYFGVSNDGNVRGLQIGKDTLNHLSRDLALYIKPEFVYSVNSLKTDDGKEFIEIVFNGKNTPYTAYDRYYLRFSDEDKVMNQKMLADYFDMKKQSYTDWENADSTFSFNVIDDKTIRDYIERANKCGRIKFSYDDKKKVLNRLGLLYKNNNLNNAGNVLFSRKKPINVKFATFASEKRITILNMDNFSGNVFECIDASMKYISLHIDWGIYFDGSIHSKEIPEVPLEAIREIVVNAFAHGNYESKSTEFEVSVYKNRIVIYSPGHFPKAYTPEQFAFEGQGAIPLNNKICSILYNDETIEKHSTGFERAFTLCKKQNIKYEYIDTGLGFRFTFYRKNVHGHVHVNNRRTSKILSALKNNPSVTIKNLSKELKVSEKTIQRDIANLKSKKIIERIGSDKTGYWKIN